MFMTTACLKKSANILSKAQAFAESKKQALFAVKAVESLSAVTRALAVVIAQRLCLKTFRRLPWFQYKKSMVENLLGTMSATLSMSWSPLLLPTRESQAGFAMPFKRSTATTCLFGDI